MLTRCDYQERPPTSEMVCRCRKALFLDSEEEFFLVPEEESSSSSSLRDLDISESIPNTTGDCLRGLADGARPRCSIT